MIRAQLQSLFSSALQTAAMKTQSTTLVHVEESHGRHDSDFDAESDNAALAALGYKQEFKRSFHAVEVFGLGFSIIGLFPSIA